MKRRGSRKKIDLTGKTFGYLTVLKLSDKKIASSLSRSFWECACTCGKTKAVDGYWLTHAKIVSCGCKRKEPKVIGQNVRRFLTDHFTVDGVDVAKFITKQRKNTKTGVKGVYLTKKGKFNVYIGFKGKLNYIGTYVNLEEATEARRQAEEKYFQPYIEKLKQKKGDVKKMFYLKNSTNHEVKYGRETEQVLLADAVKKFESEEELLEKCSPTNELEILHNETNTYILMSDRKIDEELNVYYELERFTFKNTEEIAEKLNGLVTTNEDFYDEVITVFEDSLSVNIDRVADTNVYYASEDHPQSPTIKIVVENLNEDDESENYGQKRKDVKLHVTAL